MAGLLASLPAWGQLGGPMVVRPPTTGSDASFTQPLRVDRGGLEQAKPVWTHEGVALSPPTAALARAGISADEHGIPTYDPESGAWLVTARGVLVRLATDGSLPVVLDGVQVRDVDVRLHRRLAVSREPDDRIVLRRWSGKEVRTRVLLEGPQFFNPRFSPDGTKVLVAESRAGGGHMWLVGLDGRKEDLGQGYGASWHPDGRRVIFTRVEHDGQQVLASDVLLLDLDTRKETKLAHTQGPVAMEPAVSPDGRWVAFTDARGTAVYVAGMKE